MRKAIAAAFAATLLAASPSLAQTTGHAAMGHGAMTAPKGDQGPSSQAFARANADMHTAMDIEFSGDADVDFARGMIAHHEGAVAMARVLLEHGKDPEMRELAEKIIAAQQPEIDQMNAWLKKMGK